MNRIALILGIFLLVVSFAGCNKKQNQVVVDDNVIVQPPVITITNPTESDAIILGAHCTEVLMFLRMSTTQALTGRQIFKNVSDIVNTKRFNNQVKIFMNNSGLNFNDNPIGAEGIAKLIQIFEAIQVEADKFTGVKVK